MLIENEIRAGQKEVKERCGNQSTGSGEQMAKREEGDSVRFCLTKFSRRKRSI